ncbi:flavodoxin family protein [Amphritea japonica]|uniref:NADPH-dependent FMN reductase n=1 Tax=Amphritea japonica ATCC BAA-1530 TaxID=1278309 RepID=A0A7R6ST23_9GAMM|nr:flavodoxin family protein [Amphritea japonica]BBB26866.1 NADPH-dependent FMN reductase [Amphritea japonica ATCC BAA-1530]
MTTQVKVAIAYHSGYGHTEVLANAVATGVENAGAVAQTISVADLDNLNWDALADADAIIFGSPTYMGSVSGPFKTFMDASSKIWMEQGWKDKLAAGFTNSASQSGDKLNTLIQLSIYAAQQGMNWVSLGLLPGNNSSQGSPTDLNRIGSYLGAMAQSNADEGAEVTPPQADRDTAQALGARVAAAALRWKQ